MKQSTLSQFKEIWFVDFEFSSPPGGRSVPICLVALEMKTGKTLRTWQDDLQYMTEPPYSIGPDSLFAAYYASAEMSCHLTLRWPMPENVLDLFVEFRNLTNGRQTPCGNSLLGALAWFGFKSIDASEKDGMRDLAIRGGPFTWDEKIALLNYCESDVQALRGLFLQMAPFIDMPRALLRGRYMKSLAKIEHNGIPIDTKILNQFRKNWGVIQENLIKKINNEYGIFDGLTFKRTFFENWLKKTRIPWPRLESGALDLKDDTFREIARTFPEVAPLRELRVSLSQMRLSKLAVGKDGRNRCLLSAFSARTGRNQPSNSQFIFGPAVWLRGVIKPNSGFALAYLDWSQQEFGIAAALSEDNLMIEAYLSGDPYLEFGKQAGIVPSHATKDSHRAQREQFKACVLAVQYGMGAESLAQRLGQPVIYARELLQLHRSTYKKFWEWSDAAVDHAMLYGKLWTVFGWTIHIGKNPNPRSLRNFPMQANGAEMLRIACCYATERGIKVCAPIHDAILIEAPLEELHSKVAAAQEAMSDASDTVLDGFKLRTDVKIIRYPDRYMDRRGVKMWETVWDIVERIANG